MIIVKDPTDNRVIYATNNPTTFENNVLTITNGGSIFISNKYVVEEYVGIDVPSTFCPNLDKFDGLNWSDHSDKTYLWTTILNERNRRLRLIDVNETRPEWLEYKQNLLDLENQSNNPNLITMPNYPGEIVYGLYN